MAARKTRDTEAIVDATAPGVPEHDLTREQRLARERVVTARAAWGAHRAFIEAKLGEVLPAWDALRPVDRERILDGVNYVKGTPMATPAELHQNWMRWRLDHGWSFGPELSEAEKTSPRLVSFGQLPGEYQTACRIFLAVALAC